MRVVAYQHGIYPRSQALVAATRDQDRGRATREDVEARIERDVAEFVEVQRSAGLDHFSDGLLRWQDIFRPLVESVEEITAGPLVRWFDTNAFFRAPVTRPAPWSTSPVPAVYERLDALPGSRVATLPSPYVFSRVAVTDGDRNVLMREFATSVLRPLARALAGRGFELFHLQEPWLASHGIAREDWPELASALAGFREGWEGTVVLHLPHGDAGPWVDDLRELPVDAIGVDFLETDLSSLGRSWRVGLLAGCLDGRGSLLESPEATAEFLERALDALGPPALYVSSATDLDLLPRDLAQRKVSLLGDCARRVREVVAA
jgi:5-methyltetrahydropteroyltriglutamate--homocysteine methyltransferase